MPYVQGQRYTKVINPVDEANFNGELYYTYSRVSGIPASSYVDIEVRIGGKNLFVVGRDWTSTTDLLNVEVYVNPTLTPGTSIPITPYNAITPVLPSQSVGSINPIVTDTGTLFDEFMLVGSPNNNPARVGGSFRNDEVIRMVPAGTSFLLRFKNDGTVPMDGVFKYLFFEQDADIPVG